MLATVMLAASTGRLLNFYSITVGLSLIHARTPFCEASVCAVADLSSLQEVDPDTPQPDPALKAELDRGWKYLSCVPQPKVWLIIVNFHFSTYNHRLALTHGWLI